MVIVVDVISAKGACGPHRTGAGGGCCPAECFRRAHSRSQGCQEEKRQHEARDFTIRTHQPGKPASHCFQSSVTDVSYRRGYLQKG